jgi:hypothetical protein
VAYAFDGGAANTVAGVFEREQEKAAERATTALSVFETEARYAGISYECRPITDTPADAAISIVAAARLYDLSVVLQTQADVQTFDNTIPTEILLQGGGRVLFIPHIFRDASRPNESASAGTEAALPPALSGMPSHFSPRLMPLVAISINGTENAPPDASPEKLTKHWHVSGCRRDSSICQPPAPRFSPPFSRSQRMKDSTCW